MLLGEPLFSSRTKVTTEGDYVIYNGIKYTKEDLGEKAFNNIEIGIINVSFDIYQGQQKITTVILENEISVSFIPGSPDWDELWPGVSAERAKQIWKEGYSIRNARLIDVKFRGFYAIDTLLAKQEEAKKLKEAEEKKKEEELKKEEEKLANEQEEKEKEEQEKEAENKRISDAEKLAKEKERARAEEERKRAEAERKRKKIEEYHRRVENQNSENKAIVASTAAAGFSTLYLIGGFIYSGMGKVQPEHLYRGNNINLGFDIGYSLTGTPLYFPSEKSSIDSDANVNSTSTTQANSTITVNLKTSLKLGYENKYGGGYALGGAEIGASPLLDGTNFNYNYGFRGFGGSKNIKVFGEFISGQRTFTNSNFLDSEENGKGKSSYSFDNIKAGLKFSWYGNERTASRNHISIGVIEERIEAADDDTKIQGIYDHPNYKGGDANINKPTVFKKDITYLGYMFEWKHDHHGKLSFIIYPKYPRTGKTGGPFDSSLNNEKGTSFFQFAYIRSIDTFFN